MRLQLSESGCLGASCKFHYAPSLWRISVWLRAIGIGPHTEYEEHAFTFVARSQVCDQNSRV